jgi:Zn-dependent peptidase ImmA (M78 family)
MDVNYSNGDDPANQLASASLNSQQAASLIVERAKQLVNQLIEKRGHDRPPFLPEEFARLQGIKKIVKADLGKSSGVLLRFDDGYVIKVNQNHNLARQNFSCAHEIGHIVFSELKLENYTNSIEHRTFNPLAERKARAAARERLCDAAATELLMPEMVFSKYLSGFGVSAHSIEQLASIFMVSIRAAAWRIAEVSTEPCIALLWQPWLRNRSKGLRLAWCAGPGRKTSGKSYYMPLHTYVRPPSTLHKAYENDKLVKSFKLFKLDTAVKRCSMESKGFGRGETRYVISLAFPDR